MANSSLLSNCIFNSMYSLAGTAAIFTAASTAKLFILTASQALPVLQLTLPAVMGSALMHTGAAIFGAGLLASPVGGIIALGILAIAAGCLVACLVKGLSKVNFEKTPVISTVLKPFFNWDKEVCEFVKSQTNRVA